MICFILAANLVHAQQYWDPGNDAVPVFQDCNIFDLSIASWYPIPQIRYCPDDIDTVNAHFPGAGHFYFVHEYGHVILHSGDEELVDKWACEKLEKIDKGYYYLNAFIGHLKARCDCGEVAKPGYGTPCERRKRIIRDIKFVNPYLCFNKSSGQFED